MNSNYINRRYFSIVAVPSYTHTHTHTHTHKDFTTMMNSKSFAHRLDTNTQTTMWVCKNYSDCTFPGRVGLFLSRTIYECSRYALTSLISLCPLHLKRRRQLTKKPTITHTELMGQNNHGVKFFHVTFPIKQTVGVI